MLRILIVVVLPVVVAVPAFAEDFTASVVLVKDGDSFVIEILSFNITTRNECKMLHYNAPELYEKVPMGVPDGRDAAQKLASLIAKKTVQIRTKMTRSYRNILCDVRLMDGTYVNKIMWDYLSDYNWRDKYLHLENK
jgi:endonuclease YncB( thermonuclease family)